MARIYLYETTADTGAGDVAIRMSSGAYTHPSAPGVFDPRIVTERTGLSVQRSIFSGGEFGGGDTQYGVIEFANPDGGLDAWLNYAFGRDATLKIGDDAAPYEEFTTVVRAKAGRLEPSIDTFALGWKSRLDELDQPASPATFAGTNSGAVGLEGTEDDIKGQRKPRASGAPRNISPVLVNASLRIFAWNYDKDGNRVASASVDAVRFAGSEWTLGADHPDAASLQAAAPTQGIYDTCLAESLVMLGGSSPLNGQVTADVTIEPAYGERYAASLGDWWLEDAGVAPAETSADDIAALNIAAPHEIGIYVRDETYRQILDQIFASIAAWYAPDAQSVYRFRQVTAPVDPAPVTFRRFGPGIAAGASEFDLISLAPISDPSETWLPAKEVALRYGRNWTPMTPLDVAAGVTDEEVRAFLTNEWRATDPAVDAGIAARYPDAKVRSFDTLLLEQADAEAIRDVIAGIFGAQRREYQATVKTDASLLGDIELGDTVAIVLARLLMGGGKLFNIHGSRLSSSTETAEVRLWG